MRSAGRRNYRQYGLDAQLVGWMDAAFDALSFDAFLPSTPAGPTPPGCDTVALRALPRRSAELTTESSGGGASVAADCEEAAALAAGTEPPLYGEQVSGQGHGHHGRRLQDLRPP